jgi:peptidyl-prolyl cis-trans isomerase A (cyclophilin A)
MPLNACKNTAAALLLTLAGYAATAEATIVQFQTSLGDFEVNLFDKATPETVENFLAYVTEGAYEDTVIHRSVPNFVIQGGGYIFNYETQKPSHIETHAPVVNEPKFSNKRGTIAMAKVGGKPNSATSEWFINLRDNSQHLDSDNGGYTVFGQVMDDGMEVLEEIAKLRRLGELPVVDYSAQDAADRIPLTEDNLVILYSVVIVDEDPGTADDLDPPPNTKPKKKKKGGGNGWEFFALLSALALMCRKLKIGRAIA